jgi:hypothetical protein
MVHVEQQIFIYMRMYWLWMDFIQGSYSETSCILPHKLHVHVILDSGI